MWFSVYRLHGVLTRSRREGPVGVIALVPPRRSASVCPSSGWGFSGRYGFWRGVHSDGAGWGILRDLVACRWGLAWGRLRVLSRSMQTSGKSRGWTMEESSLDAATVAMIIVLQQSLLLLYFLCTGNAQKKTVAVYTHEWTPYGVFSVTKNAYYHSV